MSRARVEYYGDDLEEVIDLYANMRNAFLTSGRSSLEEKKIQAKYEQFMIVLEELVEQDNADATILMMRLTKVTGEWKPFELMPELEAFLAQREAEELITLDVIDLGEMITSVKKEEKPLSLQAVDPVHDAADALFNRILADDVIRSRYALHHDKYYAVIHSNDPTFPATRAFLKEKNKDEQYLKVFLEKQMHKNKNFAREANSFFTAGGIYREEMLHYIKEIHKLLHQRARREIAVIRDKFVKKGMKK